MTCPYIEAAGQLDGNQTEIFQMVDTDKDTPNRIVHQALYGWLVDPPTPAEVAAHRTKKTCPCHDEDN